MQVETGDQVSQTHPSSTNRWTGTGREVAKENDQRFEERQEGWYGNRNRSNQGHSCRDEESAEPHSTGRDREPHGEEIQGENTEREEGLCWIRGVTIDQTRSGTREQRDQTQEANLVLSVKSNSKHVSSQ